MKKSILFLCSLALLASGCDKVQTVEEPPKDSSRHLTVDIDVSFASETRSVKTGWEAGDVIYVAFDDFFTDDPSVSPSETVYYMTLTYNGSSWVSAFSDEALEQYLLERESGLLAAVYYSDLPSTNRPCYRLYNQSERVLYLLDENAVFPGFYMYAKKAYDDAPVSYTVSNGKLTASLNMILDERELHFFIGGITPEDADRFSFKCSWVSYVQCYGFDIFTRGIRAMVYNPMSPVIPVAPRADGIIACGSMSYDSVGEEKEYVVNLTDNNGTPENESDDIVYTLTKTATLHGNEAINLPSLSDPRWVVSCNDETHGSLNGHSWIKMADGRKWATMNVMAQSGESAGTHFRYSDAKSFESSWGDGWRIPTLEEWRGLFTNASHQLTWLSMYESTSFWGLQISAVDENNTPGNTLNLPAYGFLWSRDDELYWAECGVYWASDNGEAQCMLFDPEEKELFYGYSTFTADDKLLVRFIVDESIETSGVGVDFNGYNDMVLWW